MGWGTKRSVGPSKPGTPNLFGAISRHFAGISRRGPRCLRKTSLCSNFLAPSRSAFTLGRQVGKPDLLVLMFLVRAKPRGPALAKKRSRLIDWFTRSKRLILQSFTNLALSGVLNRDLRQYSCDSPHSPIGARRQLELRY